eukprot:Rmarinus@m.20855
MALAVAVMVTVAVMVAVAMLLSLLTEALAAMAPLLLMMVVFLLMMLLLRMLMRVLPLPVTMFTALKASLVPTIQLPASTMRKTIPWHLSLQVTAMLRRLPAPTHRCLRSHPLQPPRRKHLVNRRAVCLTAPSV